MVEIPIHVYTIIHSSNNTRVFPPALNVAAKLVFLTTNHKYEINYNNDYDNERKCSFSRNSIN